jgi:DNA-binding NarL/FixJ family response regulator
MAASVALPARGRDIEADIELPYRQSTARGPRTRSAALGSHGASSQGRLRLLMEGAESEPRKLPARGETSIRVLVAAGHALVRAGYRAVLERDERIEVVAEASSGLEALARAAATAPDVALLDLELPGLDDLQATAAIVSDPAFAHVAVMLIALSESDERIFSALRAGATGVLSNDADPAELIRALRVVAEGQALLPAGAVRRLLTELPPPSHPSALAVDLEELTDREREVMALVGMGLSNDQIAAQLVISPATAKTHVSRAMIKLQARDRAQLVVLAYETGLVAAHANGGRAGAAPGAAPGSIA